MGGYDADEAQSVYESAPLRDLVSRVVNALLYATSPDAEHRVVVEPPKRTRNEGKRSTPVFTSETVFHLPGTIDIKTLAQVKEARRGGSDRELSRRCMVRGHWRHAPESWKDQRPRWVKPH